MCICLWDQKRKFDLILPKTPTREITSTLTSDKTITKPHGNEVGKTWKWRWETWCFFCHLVMFRVHFRVLSRWYQSVCASSAHEKRSMWSELLSVVSDYYSGHGNFGRPSKNVSGGERQGKGWEGIVEKRKPGLGFNGEQILRTCCRFYADALDQ